MDDDFVLCDRHKRIIRRVVDLATEQMFDEDCRFDPEGIESIIPLTDQQVATVSLIAMTAMLDMEQELRRRQKAKAGDLLKGMANGE